jgi:hypothetical protein
MMTLAVVVIMAAVVISGSQCTITAVPVRKFQHFADADPTAVEQLSGGFPTGFGPTSDNHQATFERLK